MGERPCGVFNTRYEQDRAILRTRWQWALFIAFLLALIVLPRFMSSHLLYLGIQISTTIIAMLGIQLMMGYTHQIHLGLAGFVGMGAYGSSLLTYHLGLNFFPAMLAGGLLAAAYGLIIGTSALRVKGLYMVIPTVSAHFIFFYLVNEIFKKWTFGTDGIEAATPSIFGFTFNSDLSYFYLVAAIALIMGILARNLVRSKIGRAWVAIRDNDLGAECLGINIFYYKLLAFAVGNFYAGIAGSLWAHYVGYHNAEFYGIQDTVYYAAFTIVGGMGHIMGAVFGTLFWRVLGEGVNYVAPIVQDILPSTISANVGAAMGLIIFALVVIVFLVLEPRGVAHRWEIFKRSYRLHPFSY
ncbi:MAG: branched-chain amino acid ABC transporter permease [Chloroflexota bacterium]